MVRGGKRSGAGRRRKRGAELRVSVTITMDPALRDQLERLAKGNDRALTREIEDRLRASLSRRDRARQHNRALADLTALTAEWIEPSVGDPLLEDDAPSWRTSPFAAEALRVALNILLQKLAPAGPMETPERLKSEAEAKLRAIAEFENYPLTREQIAFNSTPEGVGATVAFSILEALKTYDLPPPRHLRHPNHHYADVYYVFPQIRNDLQLVKDDLP